MLEKTIENGKYKDTCKIQRHMQNQTQDREKMNNEDLTL